VPTTDSSTAERRAATAPASSSCAGLSARAGYAWFGQPRFYQLLERAQAGTQTKTQAMVQGVEGPLDGLVGLVALLAVLPTRAAD
jgi:hypothetical protein